MSAQPDDRVLDNPVLSALTGPDARFAAASARVALYLPDISPFAGLPEQPTARDWRELAAMAGAASVVAIVTDVPTPADWQSVAVLTGAQMIDTEVEPSVDARIEQLGVADVPEMLDLVDRAKPGPFLDGTIKLGGYVGIRHEGRLIAMAGERMHAPGWTEVSAVCTDPDHRGEGLAPRVVRAVVAGIRERGERSFLHVEGKNQRAIDVYTRLGFTARRDVTFQIIRTPDAPEERART